MKANKKQMREALSALGEILMSPGHIGSLVIRKDDGLDENQIKSLLDLGCLKEPVEGWYIVCRNEDSHDPTNWYRVYWQFIAAFLDDLYEKRWCLSPECSLDFISGDTLIPEDLVIRSASAKGTIRELPFGTSLVEIQGDVPEDAVHEERYGVRLFPLHSALLKVSEEYLRIHSVEAKACLAKINDPSELIKFALEEHYPERALALATEFRKFGRTDTANAITEAVNEYMRDAEKVFFPHTDKPLRMTGTGTLGNRIRLMWRLMRPELLLAKDYMKCRESNRPIKEIILRLQHTLEKEDYGILRTAAFEGDLPEFREDYRSQLGEGNEDLEETSRRIDRECVLSFGLHDALKRVAKDILDSLTGGNRIANLAARHYKDWNYLLFKPGIKEGMFDASEHLQNRVEEKDTCITGSRHIPFDAEGIDDALNGLSEAFQREEDPFVRAVLGHFFLIYIQPFTAGNIQTAWLLMNSQLVAAGYPWISLPEYDMEEYMKALKETAELEHIDRLVALIGRRIRFSWNTDLREVAADLEYIEEGITGE